MLYFYNSRIFFNFEIGMRKNYLVTSLPFCPEIHIPTYFPNAKPIIQEQLSILRNGRYNICLTSNELYTFMRDWEKCSQFNKLFEWTMVDWFQSYIDFMQSIDNSSACNIVGHWNKDESLFDYKKHLELHSIKPREAKPVDPVIIFDVYDIRPELSWCIEDCLYARKHGIKSKYEDMINRTIRSNIEHIKHFCGLYNAYKRPLVTFDIPLDGDITISTIEFSDPDSIYYLYSPFDDERVRTNYLHIAKCVEKFLVG